MHNVLTIIAELKIFSISEIEGRNQTKIIVFVSVCLHFSSRRNICVAPHDALPPLPIPRLLGFPKRHLTRRVFGTQREPAVSAAALSGHSLLLLLQRVRGRSGDGPEGHGAVARDGRSHNMCPAEEDVSRAPVRQSTGSTSWRADTNDCTTSVSGAAAGPRARPRANGQRVCWQGSRGADRPDSQPPFRFGAFAAFS